MHQRSSMRTLAVPALLLLCLVCAAFADEFDTVDGEIRSVIVDPTKVITLSWSPRIFLYKHFLTDEECDHVIILSKDKLTKSMVADNESGKSVESEIRTSSGMFLSKAQDEIVTRIEEKIAAWTFLHPDNGEAMQVLKYEYGQKYEPHYDYFHDKYNQAQGGHRIATVLMYLSDVIKGGETVFPSVEDKTFKDDSWTECGRRGIAVKPRKGDALLFYSLHTDATPDQGSLHMGCPVIEGEKWSATKWLHVASFEKHVDGCVDDNETCGEWAAYGECEKNPAYMGLLLSGVTTTVSGILLGSIDSWTRHGPTSNHCKASLLTEPAQRASQARH